jgi:hypothetical protein
MKKIIIGLVATLLLTVGTLSFLGKEKREIVTEVQIDAKPEQVWEVIVDLNNWTQWTNEVKLAEGKAVKGERINITINGKGERDSNFQPVIADFDKPKHFRWKVSMGGSDIFLNERVFYLKANGGGTHVIHKEEYKGLMLPLMWSTLQGFVKPHLEAMNADLKKKVEADYPQSFLPPKVETTYEEPKNKYPKVKLPKPILNALLGFRLLTRDSGKEVTEEFLSECVREHTDSYFKIECGDVLWAYNTAFIGDQHIMIVADGASVENRIFYKLNGDEVTKVDDKFNEMFTVEKIVELVKKKFDGADVSVESLSRAAHSKYRTTLPKKSNQPITIRSGYYGLGEFGNKEIAKLAIRNGELTIIE